MQKKTAQAIVQIFETGRLEGFDAYSTVTLLKGDTGRLTYGKHQTTLGSGNLELLLERYIAAKGEYAEQIQKWMPEIDKQSKICDTSKELKDILRSAGADPIMQEVQDEFFDRVYWAPAAAAAKALGIVSPLGHAIVYDSFVHGNWKGISKKVLAKIGVPSATSEQNWLRSYVTERRAWLANHPKLPILHKTVYRMDEFGRLMNHNQWELALPTVVRGISVNEQKLNPQAMPEAVKFDDGFRVLRVRTPLMQGDDVKELQEALAAKNLYAGKVDGVYGEITAASVTAFQKSAGLTADGIAGLATQTALSL
jgi:chitosanase